MTPVAEMCRRSQAVSVMLRLRVCSTCWKACILRALSQLSACLTCLCYLKNTKNELRFSCVDANENLFWSDGVACIYVHSIHLFLIPPIFFHRKRYLNLEFVEFLMATN